MFEPTREHPQPPAIPRGLIFLTTAWLAASWLLAIGFKPPIAPSSTVYTPAARMLVSSIVLGGLVAWPLARLTAPPRTRPVAETLLDLVSLWTLLQVVIWPMRLVTTWTIHRVILIDAAICSWLAITGALIALGTARSHGGLRSLIMIVLMTWLLGPLLVTALGGNPEFARLTSPMAAAWHIASGGPAATTTEPWVALGCWWGVAVIAWLAVTLFSGPGTATTGDEPLQ